MLARSALLLPYENAIISTTLHSDMMIVPFYFFSFELFFVVDSHSDMMYAI